VRVSWADGEEKSLAKRRRTGSADTRVSVAAQHGKNPEMCIDASKMGSVARFLNHCCEPNLFVQSVFVEYSRGVHRIGIFAARDVMPYARARAKKSSSMWPGHDVTVFPPRSHVPSHVWTQEELTYDYGYVVGSVEGKTLRCLCGAKGCRNFLF